MSPLKIFRPWSPGAQDSREISTTFFPDEVTKLCQSSEDDGYLKFNANNTTKCELSEEKSNKSSTVLGVEKRKKVQSETNVNKKSKRKLKVELSENDKKMDFPKNKPADITNPSNFIYPNDWINANSTVIPNLDTYITSGMYYPENGFSDSAFAESNNYFGDNYLPFPYHLDPSLLSKSAEILTAQRLNKLKQRPKKYRCPHCKVAFSNNGQLKGHVRIHTGERPFKCDAEKCGKSFTRNEELTRHKRIHSGLRPFPCPHCCKCFGRKDHLKKHVKTHFPQPQTPFYYQDAWIPFYPPLIYGY